MNATEAGKMIEKRVFGKINWERNRPKKKQKINICQR